MATQNQPQQQQSSDPQMPCMKIRSGGRDKTERPLLDEEMNDEEAATSSALSAYRAKEEDIERRKIEMREKVEAQLGRVEEETKRLVGIRGEIEALSDPVRKEAAGICKRIDVITRDLKPLGMHCQKKEKEYKEAMEALNEKSKEKGQLISKLVELITESENIRMTKLEELCKSI